MLKRNLIRDLIIYTGSSFQKLLLKGGFALFIKDILVFRKWRKFRITSQSILEHRIPWLAFEAIEFLKRWLNKDMIVYEYGSGGSSLFISDYVQTIYSAEHDEEWFYKLKGVIETEKNHRINYQLYKPVPVQSEQGADCGNPQNYLSCMGQYRNLNFQEYVRSIDRFEDDYFDLIIVDGRARPSCILHSIKKVKRGGVLLVDNTDRDYYLNPFPELFNQQKWKPITFIGHFPYGPASVVITTKLFIKL